MTSTKAAVGMNMRCGKMEHAGPPHPGGEHLLGEIKEKDGGIVSIIMHQRSERITDLS